MLILCCACCNYCILKSAANRTKQDMAHVTGRTRCVMTRFFPLEKTLHIFSFFRKRVFKVHIFWDGHKILRNLHQLFDWQYISRTNDWWRFRKILWPSQNIWTLFFRKKTTYTTLLGPIYTFINFRDFSFKFWFSPT